MQELENLSKLAVFTAWALIMVLGVCISFIMGVTMAYYLDQAEQKLPSVWGTMQDNNLPINGDKLQVEPNYGYQTPHQYIEQPAYNVYGLEAEL